MLAKLTIGPPGMELDQSREGCEFPVRMHCCDAKATMEIILVNLLECFEYLWDSPVPKMVDRCEANLATQQLGKKESC